MRIRNNATESGSGGQQIADPDPGGLPAGRLPVTIFTKSQEVETSLCLTVLAGDIERSEEGGGWEGSNLIFLELGLYPPSSLVGVESLEPAPRRIGDLRSKCGTLYFLTPYIF
jgi:hypothetical protein